MHHYPLLRTPPKHLQKISSDIKEIALQLWEVLTAVKQVYEGEPDAYLDELIWFLAIHHDVAISKSALQQNLQEAGLTQKLLKKIARERDEVSRAEFCREIRERSGGTVFEGRPGLYVYIRVPLGGLACMLWALSSSSKSDFQIYQIKRDSLYARSHRTTLTESLEFTDAWGRLRSCFAISNGRPLDRALFMLALKKVMELWKGTEQMRDIEFNTVHDISPEIEGKVSRFYAQWFYKCFGRVPTLPRYLELV
ncbi:hypothetical protein C8J56DRAFT_893786 [Mycena floridula]|nr:hypothetical protein C8J56DRAFT_893786 [Mycena floridula]